MRITVTCEACGRRHRLVRRIDTPGPVWIICHHCELPLRAELQPSAFATPAPDAAPPAAFRSFLR